MTNDTRILNEADLEAVTGGGDPITLSSGNGIVVPHIPRDKDLLTSQMIEKLLTPGLNFPIPRG